MFCLDLIIDNLVKFEIMFIFINNMKKNNNNYLLYYFILNYK